MKHVHIILEDHEYRELKRVKGNKTWKELLMETKRIVRTSQEDTKALKWE